MGKRLIQQRRGRGTPTYRAPSHRYEGAVKHYSMETSGMVTDLIHCAGHSAPLMEISYLTGERGLSFAPEGIRVGDEIAKTQEEVVGDGTTTAVVLAGELLKKAVEQLYNVKVIKVNVDNSFTGVKKAYVKLSPQNLASDLSADLGLI